jgi:hypothetical protein
VNVSDVLGLLTFGGMVVAVFLARKRVRDRQASALAAVRIEGFEAGKAAVLASIGSTVVVNQTVAGVSANGPASDRAFDVVGRRSGDDPRLVGGVPVGLPAAGEYGEVRALRTASLIEDDAAVRIALGYDPADRGVDGDALYRQVRGG